MDVNELVEREIAAIDAKTRKLRGDWWGKTIDRRRIRLSIVRLSAVLDKLAAARRLREKLILAGPRGLALVA